MTVPVDPTGGRRRTRSRLRGLCVIVFLLGGLVFLPSVIYAIFDFGAALPWLTASGICLGLGGFGIWRADHPDANVRHALRAWIGRVAVGAGAFVAVLVALAYPGLAVAVLVIWVVLMLVLAVVLHRLGPVPPRTRP